MTVQELTQMYDKKLAEAYLQVTEVKCNFIKEMNKILNEKHLDELVLRKSDNQVGEIWAEWDSYDNNPVVNFHPLTKKKEPSVNGQTIYTFLKDFNFEDEYEPYDIAESEE